MMASNAISHGCFLLIAVVLARSLAVRDFGTFNQVWLVNQSLVYVFALGLPVSVYYFLPRLPDAKRKAFILQTLASLTILALPLSLSMYLLADRLAIYFNNPGLAHYFRIFAIYPLLAFPAISTDAILIGLDRTERAALFETVTKATMLAAVAAAGVLTHNLDVVFKALIGYAVAQALLGAWLVWSPVRRLTFHFAAADWKAQIAYAAPYGLGTLVGALNYQVDKILVSLFYPPAVFAVYAAGAFEIPLAGVAALPVVSVMMGELSRKFAAGDVQGFLRLWHQSMLRLAVPVFAVAAFLMVIAGPVVVTLFSAEYSASVGLFRIYLLFLLLRITVLEQVLAALGDTRFVFKAQAVALLVNLTLGYLLIRRSGWFGPALSAVFAGYLFGMLIILRIRHHLGVDVRRLIPWQALGRIALVAILAAGCAAAAFLLETRALWQVGAAGLLFTTVYLIGNLRTQAITTDDLRTAWGWARTAAGAFTRGEGLEHEARK
jgi:O-antigen/teichoic acid export membrane protein